MVDFQCFCITGWLSEMHRVLSTHHILFVYIDVCRLRWCLASKRIVCVLHCHSLTKNFAYVFRFETLSCEIYALDSLQFPCWFRSRYECNDMAMTLESTCNQTHNLQVVLSACCTIKCIHINQRTYWWRLVRRQTRFMMNAFVECVALNLFAVFRQFQQSLSYIYVYSIIFT